MSKARTLRTPSFSDLEPLVCDAAGLSTALAMAIEGIDRLAMEDKDQMHALLTLASAAMYAALEARQSWEEIHDQQVSERRRTTRRAKAKAAAGSTADTSNEGHVRH